VFTHPLWGVAWRTADTGVIHLAVGLKIASNARNREIDRGGRGDRGGSTA
jgi:hypothetical protein